MVLNMNNHLLHFFEESWSSKLQIQDTKKAHPLAYLSKGFFQPTRSEMFFKGSWKSELFSQKSHF